MFGRIKKFLQSSRRRAQILVDARQMLAGMDPHWAQEAQKPLWETQEMLLQIGLAHLTAVKRGQDLAREMSEKIEEARWAPIKEAHRN